MTFWAVYLWGFCLWLPVSYWMIGKICEQVQMLKPLADEPRFKAFAALVCSTFWFIHLFFELITNGPELVRWFSWIALTFFTEYVFGEKSFKEWRSQITYSITVTDKFL